VISSMTARARIGLMGCMVGSFSPRGSAGPAGAAREDAVAAPDGAPSLDGVAMVLMDLGGDDAGDVGVHVKLLGGG
jgi:hypothetical protein